MKKPTDHIDWTDIVFIPGALILSYILAKRLPSPLAVALSVVLLSFVFLLFEPRKGSLKRFVVSTLLVGIIVCTLTWLFDWLP